MRSAESDEAIRSILSRVRSVAVVGFSGNPSRPSHYVSGFLAERGYRVIPVNPGLAGQSFFGATVRAGLSDIGEQVDMVDVFRRADQIPEVVDEALAALPGLSVIWMQLGLRHDGAARTALEAGVEVVQDRCPKIEIPRLFPAGWTVAP